MTKKTRTKKIQRLAGGLVLLAMLTSCVHPKVKFQKGMLLDPLMDPAKDLPAIDAALNDPLRRVENGNTNPGSSTGATCPTCGG